MKQKIEMIEIPALGQKIQIKDINKRLISTVEFTDNFYMSKTPITQEQYKEVMGTNLSYFKGENLPVEQVSWWDAIKFCNKLSQKKGKEVCYKEETGECDSKRDGYRLPTEAEWEHACRGGTLGDRYGELDKIAWYDKNSLNKTHPVGEKEPNKYGLYDMLGNVWEWCQDWYIESPSKDVSELQISSLRVLRGVLRGGSWYDSAGSCRCASRDRCDPEPRNSDVGFRLVSSSRSYNNLRII